MKEIYHTLKQFAKEDPKEFIGSVLFMIALGVGFWALMWLGAIVEGRV